MKEKTHRQKAGFSLTALCWRSLSTPGSSGHSLYKVGQKGGRIQVNKGAWLVVDSWVWETGLAHLGRSHLQGSSLLAANIQGRKLGRTFSAHTVKIYDQTRGRLSHAPGLIPVGGFAFPSWLCLCQQHAFTLDFLQPLHGPLLCLDCRKMLLSPLCTQEKPVPTSQDSKACKWDSNPATCPPAHVFLFFPL